MKVNSCLLSFLLILTVAGRVSAQMPISTWHVIVLDKPYHVGDSHLRQMAHSKPQAKTFSGFFELPDQIKPNVATSLYVNVQAAGVQHMDGAELDQVRKQPSLGTRLLVNGNEAAVLNGLPHLTASNSRYKKMTVQISGTMLRAGRNKLEIVPGRRSQVDDIELNHVSVSSRAE